MRTAVLLMAHGSPEGAAGMDEYLRHIMTRRPPTPEFVAEMTDRYTRSGAFGKLLETTRAQGRALAERLGIPVYVGMRHWRPFIADAVAQARKDGVERLIGLPLAPQYARVSVGAYHAELEKTGFASIPVSSWHLEPALIDYWKRATRGREFVLFTAHSIPAEGADPYPSQLAEMVRAIAGGPHALAYQSKSPSPIPWLGPEVLEVLKTLHGKVSVAPIGFVSDHVEILYDLDILHRKQAEELGLVWERLPMPNTDPLLIDALTDVVRRQL